MKRERGTILIGEIWNESKREYETVDLPEGVYPVITDDMSERCTCPACGRTFPFGYMYTSGEYFRKGGVFAFYVCPECYEKERKK